MGFIPVGAGLDFDELTEFSKLKGGEGRQIAFLSCQRWTSFEKNSPIRLPHL
jgi:hypothetical protein